MLTQYNLKMPHAVYGGENAMDNITAIIKARGAKKVAMFTDKGIEGAGLFALPENAVKAAGAEYYVLDDLPPEPSYMAVQKLVDQFKASGADLIVACGGGSVMDAAKLASVLVTDDYGVKELLDNPGMAQKCVPIVLIPTTAGTGAEVTPNAIVAVPEKELKVGIVNENMIADYVILDARMIKNLPRKIAAATGVDALAHCIECFTSNKANPFSDLYALEGLDLILNNIEKACDDPEAMTEKNRMQIAAYYGGLAITASGTTAVHALSYPLGGKGHADQGNAAARDQLLHALALAAGVILSIALQQVDATPDTQGTAQTDHNRLQSINCAVEKFHKVLTFCRLFCGTQNCFFKKYRLIRQLHFHPTGQLRTGQTVRPVRPPAAASGAGWIRTCPHQRCSFYPRPQGTCSAGAL